MGKGRNLVLLQGNVGQDPEKKDFDNGGCVVNFSLATTEKWKGKDGEWVEKTEWHRLVAFNKVAEVIDKWVKKGDRLDIEGKLQTRKYEKNGVDHYTTEIVIRDMILQGSGDKPEGTGKTKATSNNSEPTYTPQSEKNDLPF